MSDFELQLSRESTDQLNKIYEYFGGKGNKLKKLFQESSEYRDAYILSGMSDRLEEPILTEICDICSCCFQLYINEEDIRKGVDVVIDKAISKIENGYYKDKEL